MLIQQLIHRPIIPLTDGGKQLFGILTIWPHRTSIAGKLSQDNVLFLLGRQFVIPIGVSRLEESVWKIT